MRFLTINQTFEQEIEAIPAGDGVCKEEIPGVANLGMKIQEIKLKRATGKTGILSDIQHTELPCAQSADLELRRSAAGICSINGKRPERIAGRDRPPAANGDIAIDGTCAAKTATLDIQAGAGKPEAQGAIGNGLTGCLCVAKQPVDGTGVRYGAAVRYAYGVQRASVGQGARIRQGTRRGTACVEELTEVVHMGEERHCTSACVDERPTDGHAAEVAGAHRPTIDGEPAEHDGDEKIIGEPKTSGVEQCASAIKRRTYTVAH